MSVAPLALAAALVIYNSLANRLRAFHGWAYVPMNVLLAVAVLTIGVAAFDLDRDALGARWAWAWVGLAIGAGAMLPVYASLVLERGRRVLRDRRLAGIDGWRAAYMVLVRIPLGTAAVEELAFRGVLLGSLLDEGTVTAVVASSIAFGLWHIVPTIDLARANRLPLVVVTAGVMLTGAAGAFLAWLRLETGSLAVPFLLHASINSLGAGAAMIALRSDGFLDPERGNRLDR